jgi:hypothetical protein
MSVRAGFVMVGCVLVGFVTSAGPGLVARAAEPQRWVEALAPGAGTPVRQGGEPERRIAQLEQRLQQLEAERRGAAPAGSVRGELQAAIARNNELMASNRALAAENQALAQESHLFDRPGTPATCGAPASDADPKAQLRYWAERLRENESGFRARLTAEQNAAVNVLLRRERELDPHNPWREP